MTTKTEAIPLRVRSHILRLLGDQLVGHDRLAIFELVKNAYDADATSVLVRVDLKNLCILVADNGQPSELLHAMGAGADHKLPLGSRREKVKLCGNGVCSDVMTSIFKWLSVTAKA